MDCRVSDVGEPPVLHRSRDAKWVSCPELYDRELTRRSSRITNPGCYATNTQLLLAPLLPYLDRAQMPTVFGVSGYSGAGTKSGEKDADGRPKTVPKVVSHLVDRS